MRRSALVGSLCLLLAATLVLTQTGAARAWSGDPTTNMAICTASADQTYPQIISDGSGGAIITWEDTRSGNSDVYAQRVDSAGATQWTANGVAICTAEDAQLIPQIVSDGSAGAIITWFDRRNGGFDIYAQRVDSAGATQWTANGVAICTAADAQLYPRIISDGSAGAIITWYDYRSGNSDVYAQRVDSAGAPQWTANGVAISTTSADQTHPRITSDGSAGAIIVWSDYRSGIYSHIYAQRVDFAGAVQWTANGAAICTASDGQTYPQITSDGSAGAVIIWYDYRSGNSDVYAQKVDSAGAVQWTANGVAISTSSSNHFTCWFIADGSGGAIITWSESGSALDVYAQRVDSSGTVQWIANGVAICTASGDQTYPQITSDGSQGAVITWYDTRSGGYDVYAQRVDSSGAVQWIASGVAICTASGDQTYPQITSDGSEGAVITWFDTRSGGYDIYAQRVDSAGNLFSDTTPPTVTLASTATSPTKVSPIPMTATFSEAVTGFAMGDITVGNGTAGDLVAVSTSVYTFNVTPSGQGTVTVDVADGVAQDTGGNGNAAAQFSTTYDSVPPMVMLTSTATSPTNVSPIPMTATFNEAVTGFVAGDILVGSGTADNFVAVSSTVYTFDVSPSGQGTLTVNVGADVAQDAASNGNVAATQYVVAYDPTPPASNGGSANWWLIVGLIIGVGTAIAAFAWWVMRLRRKGV